jgi:hypothetical protein
MPSGRRLAQKHFGLIRLRKTIQRANSWIEASNHGACLTRKKHLEIEREFSRRKSTIMRINCPRCHRNTIARRRRHGMFDDIRAFFGSWPYRCRSCGEWFHAGQRYLPEHQVRNDTGQNGASVSPPNLGPQMTLRSDPVQPAAKIVIRTDTESQLNEILSALTGAVESCRQRSHQHVRTGG